MKMGYAGVSTTDRNLKLQIDALQSTVYELSYEEIIPGKPKVIKIDFDIILYICKLSILQTVNGVL